MHLYMCPTYICVPHIYMHLYMSAHIYMHLYTSHIYKCMCALIRGGIFLQKFETLFFTWMISINIPVMIPCKQ